MFLRTPVAAVLVFAFVGEIITTKTKEFRWTNISICFKAAVQCENVLPLVTGGVPTLPGEAPWVVSDFLR